MLGGINLQMLVPAAMYRPAVSLHKPIAQNGVQESAITPTQNRNKCFHKAQQLVNYYFNKTLFSREFCLFTATQMTKGLINDAYYLRLTPIGLSIGLDPALASFLPSTVAICVGCSRVVGGFLAKVLTPAGVYGIFNVVAAVIVFCVPFLPHSFAVYVAVGTLFGTSMGR